MKTLKNTSMFVSRMTVATKLLKMCLSNILIDDTIPVAILFVISLATVTSSKVTSSKLNVENSAKWYYNISFGKPRVMGAIESLGSFGSPRSILRIKPRMSLVTTRPIPYLHQTSSVLRKSPLELFCVLLE